MAYATVDELKTWLRINDNPSYEPIELDAMLTELIAGAIAHVETACGATFEDVTPDRINLAIKFLAGFWFENPVPADKDTDAALRAVDILILSYKVWSFPGV